MRGHLRVKYNPFSLPAMNFNLKLSLQIKVAKLITVLEETHCLYTEKGEAYLCLSFIEQFQQKNKNKCLDSRALHWSSEIKE